MLRSWLTVILLCALVAGGLGYFKYRQIQAGIARGAAFPEVVQAVEVFIVREEIWQPTTSVTGEVLAVRAVSVSNELAGRIVEVGFAPGSRVEAGQVLLRLDSSEERAQLAAGRADAEIARLDLNRNQKLIKSGAAAEEARDRARARYDSAQAVTSQLRAVIEKKTLRAPFDAWSGLHEWEVGQYVDKASLITRLVGISDDVWVDFTLPQQQAHLRVGEVVAVQPPNRGQTVRAEIIARDAFVNDQSRNVKFRALGDNRQIGADPGSIVSVEVPLGAERVATLVPLTAVRRDSFGARVFVLRPAEEGARAAERAEQRTVTLGSQRGDMIIVAEGLQPGQRIAASGAFKLREGVLVNASQAEHSTVMRGRGVDSGGGKD